MGKLLSKLIPVTPCDKTTKTLAEIFEEAGKIQDWLVTVVCEEKRAAGFGHAFLLFKPSGEGELPRDLIGFRCDLGPSQNPNSVHVKKLGITSAEITLEKVDLSEYKNPRCLKPYPLTSVQAAKIFQRIESDIRKQSSGTPILYNPAGFHESFESSFGKLEHQNCLSYCMDVLRELDIKVGNKRDLIKLPRRTIPRVPMETQITITSDS